MRSLLKWMRLKDHTSSGTRQGFVAVPLLVAAMMLTTVGCGDDQSVQGPEGTDAEADAASDTTVAGNDVDATAGVDAQPGTDVEVPPDAADVSTADAEQDATADAGDDAQADASVDAGDDAQADGSSTDAQDDAQADTQGDTQADAGGCKSAEECPAATGACQIATCEAGVCGVGLAVDGTACEDGDACTAGDACQAGKCAAGQAKSCDDANPCTDDSCDATKGCVNLANTATCTDGDACTEGDACADSKCAPSKVIVCDDANPCTDDTCDGAKGCVNLPNTATCTDGDACTEGDVCGDGKCAPGKAISCDDSNPCTEDSCDVATGCKYADNTVACSDGDACTENDVCAAGACVPGIAKSCDDGNVCTLNACDKVTGACSTTPNSNPCDDSNKCTVNDTCAGGSCAGEVAPACDDGNPCTDDACDPLQGCTAKDNTATCGADDQCITAGVCAGGKCVGTPVTCDDGNPCTKDLCEAKQGCIFAPIGGVPCDDGDLCTLNDTCDTGKCAAGKDSQVCDDGNPCTDDSCDKAKGCVTANNTADCSDGDACTAGDKCAAGTCGGGAATVCDDGNPCTTDSCDKASGCKYDDNTLACAAGPNCEQGLCTAGKCVATGKIACDDGNPCTKDSCVASKCVNTAEADGTVCAKGDLCITDSLCKASACVAGTKTVCDDKNPCTDDFCDPKAGCNLFPNTAPCDDGNKCTVGDKCGVVAGQGSKCIAGAALDPKVTCDDANVCTTEACDPAKGCTNPAVVGTPVCDDNNKCTVGETCSGGKCQGGSLAGCDDGNACTADNCDPATGNCSWQQIIGACDDKNPCTTSDACAGLKCAGVAVSCDDKNPCTTDSCDIATGKCVNTALNAGACDDGSLCTANDACVAGKCVGAAQKCDDGNTCTDDSCDPATGKCTAVNNTAPCGGVDLCTTGGTCGGGVCQGGKTPKCDDKNPCTTDTCDAKTGTCGATAGNDGATCDDGIACTATSACKNGTCTPTAACSVFTDAFDCGGKANFTVVNPAPDFQNLPARKVIWAVDQLAATPDAATHACTLNYNNNTNYCDPFQFNGNNYCQLPKGTATSPELDFTITGKLVPSLTMDIYYDVDINTGNSAGLDAPKVTLIDAATNGVLGTWVLPVAAGDIKVWKNGYKIDMPQAAGKKVKVVFGVNIVPATPQFGGAAYQGNQGVGIYVDNVKVQASYAAESVCADGLDNDGNGKTDCDDFACTGNVLCGKVIVSDDMACTSKAWTVSTNTAAYVWAVDQTPAAVVAKTGTCTLNYNNGTTYGTSPFDTQPHAGAAQWTGNISLAGLTAAAAKFWVYQDVEPNGACQTGAGCNNADRLYVLVSSDNFNNCGCNANQTCNYNNNVCNTTNTKTFVVPKDTLKTWQLWTVDLTGFVGKNVQMRFKFDTNDVWYNGYPGVFIDDFAVLGK